MKNTFLFILLILLSFNMFAQKELFQKHIYSNETKELPYRLFVPKDVALNTAIQDVIEENVIFYEKNTKKYPLVLFMHGAGERGCDNNVQLTYIDAVFGSDEFQKEHPCFVFAPQCPNELKWVEVSWSLDSHIQPETTSYSMELTMEIIDQLIEKYPIDTDRLYVTGLSMGGFGTWDIISRYPNTFAAAIPICGGGDENTAFAIHKTPIWAFHGANDKAVKTSRSRNMIEAIRDVGGNPKYTEYPKLGHLCWNEAYATEGLFDWLFSQKL